MGFRGDGAQLQVAEAEAGQPAPAGAVLVVTRGQPDLVGEGEAECLDRGGGGGHIGRTEQPACRRYGVCEADQGERQAMGPLRRKKEEEGTEDAVEAQPLICPRRK